MRHALVGLVVLACTRASSGPPPVLTTTAERTQYVRTGRYDEAVRLCRDFARAYRDVSCRELGVTGGGRPIVALTIARKPGLPVAYIFNAAFEQKEYMEAYVIEEAARAMLAADPSLQAAFDAALAADPELAKSPQRRLEWFYRRHPAWDERIDLLPVYRSAQPPVQLEAR